MMENLRLTCVWYLWGVRTDFIDRPAWLTPVPPASVPTGEAADVCLPGVRGRMHLGIHLSLYRPAGDQK